jgi:RecA-family ATPase
MTEKEHPDFNDTLRNEGPEMVRERINKAQRYKPKAKRNGDMDEAPDDERPSTEPPPVQGPDDYGLPDDVREQADHSDARKFESGNGASSSKRTHDHRPPLSPLPIVDMSNWDNEPVPEQEWTVFNRIPRRQVTLYSGEGGAGKSMKILHLCAAHSAEGREWLGTLPEPGPAIFVDAEDAKDVMHIRLAAITRHYGISFADLIAGGLNLIALAGDDAVLATTSRNGKIEPTPRYHQILEMAGDIKPVTVGIASAANVFAGNENDRSQVQQFVGLLTRIAIVANGSVTLIAHPSLTGINTGTGLSGSTQWHNAVRARIYETGIKPESGEQPDNDLREIEFKKNQYGPKAETIVVRYTNGLFLPLARTVSTLDKLGREREADELFLTLLNKFVKRDENISSKFGAHAFAPTVFEGEPEAKAAHLKKSDFKAAMGRLFDTNKIHNEPYGPASRKTHRLVVGPSETGPSAAAPRNMKEADQ